MWATRGVAQRVCRRVLSGGRGASTLASVRAHAKADRTLEATMSKCRAWSQKIPHGSLRKAAEELRALDASAGEPRRWHTFPQADVARLEMQLLGGNVTVLKDAEVASGQVAVYSMGQPEMVPSVELTSDGCLEVVHDHGYSSYVGQTEPVHTVVVISDALEGNVDVRLQLGEVWVIGSGLETQIGPTGTGSTITHASCNLTCGIGDVSLIDCLPPDTSITSRIGDCRILLRDGYDLQAQSPRVAVHTFMGDMKTVAHASVPIASATWNGAPVEPVKPEAITNGANNTPIATETPDGHAIHIRGDSATFGDCRLVRFVS